ncbi:MAG TPA: HNH endonuclease [Gaiellaceae bacterium]
MEDEHLRNACFLALDVLCAQYGEDVPYVGGLSKGFPFQGERVAFLQRYKGIHQARQQTGSAPLSIMTSAKSPYDDEALDEGFLYAYRNGPIDQFDNRALRAAYAQGAPLVYFVATRPDWYKPIYPVFVTEDDPIARHVLVSPGRMIGPLDEPEPVPVEDPLERKYAVRETRVRLHQARFRGRVLVAYSSLCAICRLKESRLLDAAHIAGDLEEKGEPVVSNGMSLCSIHHRAFDQDLVGVSPDFKVHVAKRLLEDEDGPMLELLKGFNQAFITLPSKPSWRPDPARLAERFERFQIASA